MSRAQWCCPAAVSVVVPGLCRGAAAVGGGASQQAGTVAAPADDGRRVPGRGKGATRDGIEPGVPVRARAVHGQAPGPVGRGSAEPSARVGLEGPGPAAPTPVELSVLRV
ncbi:hypothetical protein OG963_24335 [Streptomyces sp. NBC_01707]|uniref:hypothetical protein n=1 Tax=unclassified Streptomyces TaxID=2593676 RepID=UPI000B88CAA7|nr:MULTISPECIES: hypothetical protein [unclassified Streptomyces]MDX3771297.1 hypothetical protein [Streptomyces sp. AK08-01B]MDX3816653.1 hypothetical protein [Streptomyces sp. AK08-01A]